jgi:1-acyl-sn-glycerol-3-phosphate acyltransferase
MKHDWHGQDNIKNIPADQGLILAINHLSYADIFADSLFAYEAGRYPVFLAKSSLFDIKVLGSIIRKLGQLPVYRGQADAALVLRDAEQGIKNGACVIFYPEATVTRDPNQWPMVAKTGVARLALATGAPVIPIAHWGAQKILPYGSFRPHLVPRTTVQVSAGPPVDLSEWEGQPMTTQVLRAATEKIMKDITALLAGIRGETPPAEPYHPAVARRKARQEARERDGQSITDTPADSGPTDPGAGDVAAGDSSTVDSSTEATPT